MIRIVLLLDSYTVSAWVYESIFQITKQPNSQIVLAVINKTPKSSGNKSPFLYRLYRGLDRRLLLKKPDAFAKKNLKTLPDWNVSELFIQPIQKKFSDYFDSQTLDQIKAHNPDVIIRFGFRILRGEILNLAPLGVWSYHHGDPQAYRGGPPCFWEVINQEQTTGAAILQLSEKLDDGLILYQSWAQTDPLSVQRNANKVFWSSSFFIARVLQEIALLGIIDWKLKVQNSQPKSQKNIPILTPPNFSTMLLAWIGLWSRNFSRKLAEGSKKPYWEITVAKSNPKEDILTQPLDFNSIKPPVNSMAKGSFWADPFPIEHQGKTYVFFEDFDYPSNKGRIAVGNWDGISFSETQTVLEEDWHLSYPFIYEENGFQYLIPESGDAGKLFIYQALEFPTKWEKLSVFFDGEAHDPTIIKKDDLYWLFVNKRPHPGTSAFVELNAYSSPDLLNPTWTPHALNPIVSDVRSSRPAGRIFEQGVKLYRPAQDSGKRYGHRIKIQEIKKLTETSFEEVTVRILEGDEEKGILGTHTFNFTTNWIFSDAYSRV